MHGTAILAGARLYVGVERVVERRPIFYEVLHRCFDEMHEGPALEAIPPERIEVVWPRRLDDETDRTCRPLWGMPHMWRQQEHIALADRHVVEPPAVHDLEHHVALELIEK